MNRDLRIVFMGTPQFAVASLRALVEAEYNIVGVITAPDRPAGRGRNLQQSDIKKYALSLHVPVLQPPNLKDPYFLEALKSLKPNLQIVVAFRMLPKMVWQLPEYGTFNLHASLLPNYRGAAPIHWAIMNGEEKTGVTTFFIDEKIDTGAIIIQDETGIDKNETVGSLHVKLMDIGSKLVIETVKLIESGTVKTTMQPDSLSLRNASKLDREVCRIDWSQDVTTVYNKIRGLNPFPTAWSVLNNDGEELPVKIFDVEMQETKHQYTSGRLITKDNGLMVATQNGFIILKTIQMPGKRKMNVKSLLNGFDIKQSAKML